MEKLSNYAADYVAGNNKVKILSVDKEIKKE